ncbi:MAG: MobC family plasmid mobilization relaxosome protein [Candidatus Thiodiazotropha sp. (ex Lucina pensylvanica)]|nr:MobC family plasmid mobilization relaxosome protein [Candidatus Thiodiazotropha sp. (ex Lucina pensylvanica)]
MSTPPNISLKNSKLASPFSLRLTFKERTILEQAAGNMPLGAYIRSKLLNESEAPRRVRKRTRKPLKDEQALALLLGELGKARIANNLNQLAKAANTGSLPVTPDTEKALQRACDAIQDMRDLLLQALGFPKAGGVP